MVTRSLVLGALLQTCLCYSQHIDVGPVLVSDTFDRFTTATEYLGTPPGEAYAWKKRLPLADGRELGGIVTGANGAVMVRYSSPNAPQDTGVWLDGLLLADAAVEVLVGPSAMPDRCHTAYLSYRAASGDAAAGGRQPGAYHVELSGDWSGTRDVKLWFGNDLLASADIGPERDPQGSHRLKVAFAANRHMVWVDSALSIEYWEIDRGRRDAGLLGFGGSYSAGPFDDFTVSQATLKTPLTPDNPPPGRFPPLVFQGRPFFALGTFDRPGETDLLQWLSAGCNTAIVAALDPASAPDTWLQDLRGTADWMAANHVAAVYYPLVELFSKSDGQATVTKPEEIDGKAQGLRQILGVTAPHPQTLGYWPFDEPENALYKAFSSAGKQGDTDLAQWIASGMRWTYDTLKAADTDAYVMPTIAWWTTYRDIAPIYDVNVPNEYPTHEEDEALTGPLYNVVYDAALAADAVEATGRKGFLYMPGIFDNLGKPWRAPTVRELRYTCFAPLTQGAVGLLPWRLGRCSAEYRKAAVYPVLTQVGRLLPWLTGTWVEGAVTSDHDQATVEYLREFPTRIRTVAGEEDAPTVETAGVPDCSYMVRRRPSGSYLLLAVNNRKEPVRVTFTIGGIAPLPAAAHEALDFRRVPIVDGKVSDELEPFGVRAYIIDCP